MRFIKNTLLVLMSFAAAIIGVKFLNGINTDTISQHKMQTLFYAYLIVFVVMWAYAFFTGLISLGLSIRSKRKVPYISSLITKILMIPFFVVNLLMWIQVLGFFGKISVALLIFGGILILGIPTISKPNCSIYQKDIQKRSKPSWNCWNNILIHFLLRRYWCWNLRIMR